MTKLLLLALSLGACATTPCKPAHEVMADRGMVVECYERPLRDDPTMLVTKCLIMTKAGVVEKTVTRRHCGL